MDDPDVVRWVWLVAAVALAAGELTVAGGFFLLPFAIGALVASVLAFGGVGVPGEVVAFVAVSAVSFGALRPLARRLDRDGPTDGIGARRLIGRDAVVLQAIAGGPDELGLVRVDREEWRAQSVDGAAVVVGATVRVVEQRGTRVLVHPVATPSPALDPVDPTPPEEA
ncbi:MAG: NfeD family protein [Acidimicrobiia bacterium]|nr:NfeD family protein [Acidimicrobiia bacterium]